MQNVAVYCVNAVIHAAIFSAYTASPMITKHPRSVVVRESNVTSVECLANAIGIIHYQWEKYFLTNESWMTPSNKAINFTSPKLIFIAITEQDEGIYRCIASNNDGSKISNNATITVYGK